VKRFRHNVFGKDPERPMRGVSPLPTLFTLGNLFCGFAAITYSLKAASAQKFSLGPFLQNIDPLVVGCYLILAAMFFDLADGRIARMTRSTSRFGIEIDSLADIVSFCVAPGVMAKVLIDSPEVGFFSGLGWVLVVTFVACGTLRLARYNVEAQNGSGGAAGHFAGMPTPGAAGLVVSVILFRAMMLERGLAEVAWGIAWALPFVMALAGLMMVSRVRYAHVGNRLLRGRRSLWHVVMLVFLLTVAFWHLEYALIVVFWGYFLHGPLVAIIRHLAGRGAKAQKAETPTSAPTEADAAESPSAPAPSVSDEADSLDSAGPAALPADEEKASAAVEPPPETEKPQ